MAATEMPAFTIQFDDVLPIALHPPSDEPSKSPAAPRVAEHRESTATESDMNLIRRKDRNAEALTHPHPIPSMQEAFNESLEEATTGSAPDKPKLREHGAKARRERLVSQGKGDHVHGMRWRFRPGQEQHELCKLMSQVAFGMYLLMRGMANSDDQVVTIIQGHIDEIDEFLEVALEDFQEASMCSSGRRR